MNNRLCFGRPLAALFALALIAVTPLPAAAGPYDSLIVFGDSISDSGNNAALGLFNPAQVVTGNHYVPSHTYGPVGTYSNGPVWATPFAASIGLPLTPSLLGGTNFAFGGASTSMPAPNQSAFPFSLLVQTQQFLTLSGGVASPNSLFVIEGGGNNARGALGALAMGADFATTAAATAALFASDIGNIVDSLQAAGAANILVWNAPNLGIVPAILAAGPMFAGAATVLSTIMNNALALRLAGEAGVTTFDVFGFGSQAAAAPAAFGFTNVTDACGAIANANCSTYLWWDGIHPTTAAHAAIAQAVFAVAVPVPEPETYALMLLGLSVIGWQARRRAIRRAPAPIAAQ